MLTGTEVKACRAGRAHLNEAYVQVIGGEAFLVGSHVAEYAFGNRNNHATDRLRKLLLHRREVNRVEVQLRQKGLTAVPLALYFSGGRVKCEVGIGRGKREVDRRHDLRAKQASREADREVRGRAKNDAGRHG